MEDGGRGEHPDAKMERLRFVCAKEIPIQQQKMEAFALSFSKSLEAIRARTRENVQNKGKLEDLKTKLRTAEDDFVKTLAVKTRKEAERMSIMDSLAATKARIEKLRFSLQDQKAKRDKYASIVSQQSTVLTTFEENDSREREHKNEVEKAISWYNRVLDVHIEGGNGVKFTFKNVSRKNSGEEFSFTILLANETYSLLDCVPPLSCTKELIHELNKTDGLFKFVRIMREKFQEAANEGFIIQSGTHIQDSSMVSVSVSAPALSVSTERSGSPTKKFEQEVKDEDDRRPLKNAHSGPARKPVIMSPASATSVRKSPRLLVKK